MKEENNRNARTRDGRINESISGRTSTDAWAARLFEKLDEQGFANLVTRNFSELDLRNAAAVDKFLEEERPEIVMVAAATVGGIKADDDFPVRGS